MKKALLLSTATLGWLVHSASAQPSLFSTTDDFTLFSGSSAAVSSSYYSDSSTMNGLGNAANAGGAGGVGSLQLTAPGGWGPFSSGPGVEGNQAFLSAIDPGAIAAWSAGSGYGPGTLVAYSGILSFDAYRGNLTDWNQFGVLLNYDGHWDNFFWSTATDFTGADGRTWTHCDVPYTISTVNAGLSYFGFDLTENTSGNIAGETLYIDNFQVTVVPEPATFALLGLGLTGFLLRRYRQG